MGGDGRWSPGGPAGAGWRQPASPPSVDDLRLTAPAVEAYGVRPSERRIHN